MLTPKLESSKSGVAIARSVKAHHRSSMKATRFCLQRASAVCVMRQARQRLSCALSLCASFFFPCRATNQAFNAVNFDAHVEPAAQLTCTRCVRVQTVAFVFTALFFSSRLFFFFSSLISVEHPMRCKQQQNKTAAFFVWLSFSSRIQIAFPAVGLLSFSVFFFSACHTPSGKKEKEKETHFIPSNSCAFFF